MISQKQQQMLHRVAQTHHLRFVILHGSYATHLATERSDLDIAMLGKKKISNKEFLLLHQKLSQLFKSHELDLKTLEKADPLFRYEIIRDGLLLYGDSTDYEEYKAMARRMYQDAAPLFRLEKLLIRKNQQHLNARYA